MQERGRTATGTTATPVPATLEDLRKEIQRAGYYPELVADSVTAALGDEPIVSYVVHQETTFDSEEVRRHVTVLVLTPTRLVVGHTDDHVDPTSPTPVATTSTEVVALSRVRAVVVTRVVRDPVRYTPGQPPQEVTVTVGWGAVARLDLEPAGCSDPSCEADHGYTGTATADDLALRVSGEAEGSTAVTRALQFAAALSAATARPSP